MGYRDEDIPVTVRFRSGKTTEGLLATNVVNPTAPRLYLLPAGQRQLERIPAATIASVTFR